jgi:predicted alpha/beta hydrolase
MQIERFTVIADVGMKLDVAGHGTMDGDTAACVALINAGTTIRSRFYTRLASYLGEAGIPLVVHDQRGVGAAGPQPLRGFHASVAQ